jgi:hypothetical protein
MLKTELGFPPFLTPLSAPFAYFSREMGQNGVPDQLLIRFAPLIFSTKM